MMTTHDRIQSLRPASILGVVPPEIFIERDDPSHPYIRSGRYYEIKYAIAKFLQPQSILEIGVRFGYSLATFIMASDAIKTVVGWDNCCYHPMSNEIAADNLKKLPKKFDLQLHAVEAETAPALPGAFDLVHVDGPHYMPWTLHLLNLCKGKARAIIVDDYFNCPDDADAAKRFCAENPALIRETVVLDSDRGECLLLLN
jgi:hypothetical protein